MNESTSQGGAFGRREVLKKAAVAGAVGWTAPLIISSVANATNSSGTCPDKVCVDTYFARWERGGSCMDSLGGGGTGGGGNCTLGDLGLSALPSSGCAFVKVKSFGTNTWSFYLAPGFSVTKTGVKAGAGCCNGSVSYTGECGTTSDGFEYGDVVNVHNDCLVDNEISNLSLVICGPPPTP